MTDSTNKVLTTSSGNHELCPVRTESTIPKAYRLIMRGDGNGNNLPALQGLFTWNEGSDYGAEWRTLETQEFPFLDDSIPFGPIPNRSNSNA